MGGMARMLAVPCAIAALGAAGSAAAQSPEQATSAGERISAVRLEIGGATISRGVYCAYGYFSTGCESTSFPYTNLIYSGELDAALARFAGHGPTLGVALAARYMNGAFYRRSVAIWEPTADLVLRFGSYTAGPSFRLRIGVGGYIARAGNTGVVGRAGFGFSLRGRSPWGVALDATWETGSFRGRTIFAAQYMIGPELSF